MILLLLADYVYCSAIEYIRMYHLSARLVLSRCSSTVVRGEKKLLINTSYRLKRKSTTHIPVMLKEVLHLWLPNNTNDDTTNRPIHLIDGTVGMGGHTLAALQSNNNVHVLGIDRDASMIYNAKKHIQSTASSTDVSSRVDFHHGSFTDISQQLSSSSEVDGLLIDLGMNSIQISNPNRGFTFRNVDCPLDMRFDTTSTNTSIKASDVVNEYPKSELSSILTKYADEPYADEIAMEIVEWRTQVSQGRRAKQGINSTLELRYIIEEAVDKYITLNEDIDDEPEIEIDTNKRYHTITTPTTKPTKQIDKKKRKKFESYRNIWNSPKWLGPKKQKQLLSQYQQRKVRHANHVMRCFQAIRIEVNNELEHIKSFFQQFDTNASSSILQVGGRIVVIVFHPGEDLIVRQGMDKLVDSGNYKLVTPKEEGLRPIYEEVRMNGRSRTARLHAVERIR